MKEYIPRAVYGCEGCVHEWYVKDKGCFTYTGVMSCKTCSRYPELRDWYTPKRDTR